MQQLLNANDIAFRYKCSLPTARSRMRQMKHMEKPLLVTEDAIVEWEQNKTFQPAVNISQEKKTSRLVKSVTVQFIPKRKG